MVKVNCRAQVKNENRIKIFEEKVTPGFEENLSKKEEIQKYRLSLGKKMFSNIIIIERSQLVQSTFNLEFCFPPIYLTSTKCKICFYFCNQ